MKALLRNKVNEIFANLLEKFPEIQTIEKFEQLEADKQKAIKMFFQQQFVSAYKELKKHDENITPSQFYKNFSLNLHPDKLKPEYQLKLGNMPFEQLTQIKDNFSLEFLEFSLVKNPINLYESNYQINLKLQSFNQKLITNLKNHSNFMRLLMEKLDLIASIPFDLMKLISTFPTNLLNSLLSYFIHYSALFHLEIYHDDYLQKALIKSISSQIPQIDFSKVKPEMSTLEDINYYISLNKKLISQYLKIDPDFVQEDAHNFFDLFDSFVKIHQIPGILPREQWSFSYVYEQIFYSLSILEHLQSNYPGQMTFKEHIINFAKLKQSALVKEFESYTIDEIIKFINIFDSNINQEMLLSQKEQSMNISACNLKFTEIVFDGSYAYYLKWEDFKQSFDSWSVFEKTTAIFGLLALGVFAVINEIIFEVNKLIENIFNLAINLLSSLGLLLLTAAVKIQQPFTAHPEGNQVVTHSNRR